MLKYLKRPIEIPLIVATVSNGSYHLFLEARLYGRPVHMLLDTGASSTVLDHTLVTGLDAAIEIETDQLTYFTLDGTSMDRALCRIKEFSLGDLILPEDEYAVTDFTGVNAAYAKAGYFTAIGGILGCDILLKYQAVINLKRKILFFPPPENHR